MKKPLTILGIIASLAIFLGSCASLPPQKSETQQIQPGEGPVTSLSMVFTPAISEHGNDSGFLLLTSGKRALIERLFLSDIAEHSIDAQYYIWNSDKSGKLLMQRLLLAAERGVSIRLLLDDFSIGDRNDTLQIINSHPNIQVRVYNPFVMRSRVSKWLNFAFDFDRLNRRMHNKTFTVDGAASITGGRNIGDEYFGQNEHLNFHDTDLLSVGPVVQQISQSFSNYWNSPWAVSIDLLFENETENMADNHLHDFLALDLANPIEISLPAHMNMLEEHFRHSVNELVWAPALFIADEPGGSDKEAYSDKPKLVARYLMQIAENSEKEILIESAYLVLNEEALELAERLGSRGVRVRALTNSMASNDVLPNHASYAMVRKEMLEHGIELYELRPDAKACLELIGREEYCDNDSFLGLHAKAAVFDRKTVYVGSLNFNLRSAYLNTEAAMFINSPVLADRLSRQIEFNLQRENSWQPVIREGDIHWITEINNREESSEHDPQTSWLERVEAGFLTLLPGALYF